MGNIACFNDLSVLPLCQNEAEAEERVRRFVTLLKEVRNHTGITKVRHAGDISMIRLTEGMTMQDYCNQHIHEPAVAALVEDFLVGVSYPPIFNSDITTLGDILAKE